MRECLGWATNCGDERRCPQNWLELAVTELPMKIHCHVCEQEVALELERAEFERSTARGAQAAFPVVPCAGAPAAITSTPVANLEPPSKANGAEGPARRAPDAARAPAALHCLLLSGESIKVEKDTTIIGRSRTCDIIIPSAKVSRQHASVNRSGDDFFMEDLGSANGVWRDGEKITRAKIEDGDVFTISEETLTFEFK